MEMNHLYVGTLIVTLIYIARMRLNSRKQDRRNNERRMCFQHVPIERRVNTEDRRA